jgi:protein dpy-30
MPVRQYLDHTVVPTILQALTELAKERPDKPIEFVANYLMKHAENEGGKKSNSKDEE